MKIVQLLFIATLLTAFLTGCGAKNGTIGGAGLIPGTGNLIDVRLEGANDSNLTEIFGKVVSSAPTVVSAKRYATNIVADNPQACWLIWRAEIGEGDAFQLQSDMIDMFGEIYRVGGNLELYGVPYRYSQAEVDFVKGIRVVDATSRSLRFMVDHELARDKEMAE